MDRETAKGQIKEKLSAYLDSITQKKGKKYICPLCGSGSGNNGNYTPALSVNGEKWQCFSCNSGGDIFSLIALQNGLDSSKDFHKVLDIAAATLNIDIDNAYNTEFTQYTHNKQDIEKTDCETKEVKTERKIDYSGFLAACKANVGKTDYYTKRGLEIDTIERFSLGYLTAETIAEYKEACRLPAYIFKGDIIIPYNKSGSYWIARETQTAPNAKSGQYPKWKKPKTENAGCEPVYNEAELDRQSLEPIFITEAPLDSISIMQAGGTAIAIGGTGQDKIEAALDSRPAFNRSFIMAFDNPKQDTAGATATEKLKAALDKRGIKYIAFNFADSVKDCNAYLIADKKGFYRAVKEHIEAAKIEAERDKERIAAEYNKDSGAERLKDFIEGMKIANTPPTPTGFKELDSVLDGGLYEGLYIVGAISSLGKTTLILQIADQIAASGQDILIFSLEMAAVELMAKTISRETLLYCRKNNINTAKAKTVRGITDQSRYSKYDNTEKSVINEAIKAYKGYAGNIIIKQGLGDIGVKEVKETIEKHKEARGKTPIIIIDYLQILAPYDPRSSDKQNTDKAVLELKRISRDYKTPVIAISSFNRDNYTAAATMTAFKESGAIEYSSDILIALQPQGMKEASNENEKKENRKAITNCKAKEIRPIEAVILKNRNGATGSKVQFNYYALFNYFEEPTEGEKNTAAWSFKPFEID